MAGKAGRPKGSTRSADAVLTEQERAFIKAYLKCGSYAQAAVAAGYTEHHAHVKGHKMAKRPPVAAAIATAKKEVAKELAYDQRAAVKELDDRLKAADKAKQHSAVAKLMELKMKAHGLLVEKFDVRQSGFNVNIVGLTADGKPPEIVLPANFGTLALPAMAESARDDDGAGLID